MKRVKGIFVDEAGAYTPGSLGDAASETSGQWPFIVGFTGQDRGVDGWTERSPVLSEKKMVELGLMKPIAFQGIGDAENPPQAGTEEAWEAYRSQMFADVKTAKTLKLPQPHELDAVVVAPTANVREFAHRIAKEHEQRGVPLKIWCFDPAARDSRWSTVVSGFEAPKRDGDPKRILVTAPSQIAEALHLHAECYDVLTPVNKFAMDQLRGRLNHVKNDETGAAREKARTYLRVQWLEAGRGEPYVRDVAAMTGFALREENETWCPLHAMIDKAAFDADEERKGLSEPEPIPDVSAIARRKRRRKEKQEWTPLQSTSPFVIELERKRAQRKKEKEDALRRANAATPVGVTKPQPAAPSPEPAHANGTARPTPPVQSPRASLFRTDAGALKDGEYSAKAEKKSITITVRGGTVENLSELANAFGATMYMGSLSMVVRDAVLDKKTGAELAKSLLAKLLSLNTASARRSSAKKPEHADSGERIEVRIPGSR